MTFFFKLCDFLMRIIYVTGLAQCLAQVSPIQASYYERGVDVRNNLGEDILVRMNNNRM